MKKRITTVSSGAKWDKIAIFEAKNGAPGGIRTHDLLLRRQTLYPAELRVHTWKSIG